MDPAPPLNTDADGAGRASVPVDARTRPTVGVPVVPVGARGADARRSAPAAQVPTSRPSAPSRPRPVPRPGPPSPHAGRHQAAALVVAALSAASVIVVWWLFVVQRTGRLLDKAAFEGAEFGRNALWQVAEPVLDVISTPFVALVLIGTMVLALLRRRVLFAVQVVVLIAGANLTTQVLKRFVLDRPNLGLADMANNTLPSGHTTAAAACAAALVFAVPRRMRPVTAVLGAAYTAATGVSTLVGAWHRPSDVVAAVLVVLAWAGLASAIGAGRVVVPGTDRPRETAVVAGALVLGGVAAAVGAALALQRSLAALPGGLGSTAELLTAYGGGALGVVAVTGVAFGTLLLMRRAADPHDT